MAKRHGPTRTDTDEHGLARTGADVHGLARAGAGKRVRKKAAAQTVAEGEAMYSRNPEFLGQAFSLFCKGMSLANVAAALDVEWPSCSARTLQRIARENGWEKSRAAYLKMYADAAASAEGLVPEIVLQLQKLRMQMEARGLLEVKDIYAYRQLVEDLMWYTGKHPRLKDDAPLAVSGDVEIAALLAVIQEDDVVGAAWRKRRRQIQKAYEERLASGEKVNAQRKGAKSAKGTK